MKKIFINAVELLPVWIVAGLAVLAIGLYVEAKADTKQAQLDYVKNICHRAQNELSSVAVAQCAEARKAANVR